MRAFVSVVAVLLSAFVATPLFLFGVMAMGGGVADASYGENVKIGAQFLAMASGIWIPTILWFWKLQPRRPRGAAKDPAVIEAHRHSSWHRAEVLASEVCGCFYCRAIFPPSSIVRWIDDSDGEGQTAMCPRCNIDSVIGSQSGYPITEDFLAAMYAHWF